MASICIIGTIYKTTSTYDNDKTNDNCEITGAVIRSYKMMTYLLNTEELKNELLINIRMISSISNELLLLNSLNTCYDFLNYYNINEDSSILIDYDKLAPEINLLTNEIIINSVKEINSHISYAENFDEYVYDRYIYIPLELLLEADGPAIFNIIGSSLSISNVNEGRALICNIPYLYNEFNNNEEFFVSLLPSINAALNYIDFFIADKNFYKKYALLSFGDDIMPLNTILKRIANLPKASKMRPRTVICIYDDDTNNCIMQIGDMYTIQLPYYYPINSSNNNNNNNNNNNINIDLLINEFTSGIISGLILQEFKMLDRSLEIGLGNNKKLRVCVSSRGLSQCLEAGQYAIQTILNNIENNNQENNITKLDYDNIPCSYFTFS